MSFNCLGGVWAFWAPVFVNGIVARQNKMFINAFFSKLNAALAVVVAAVVNVVFRGLSGGWYVVDSEAVRM